MTWTHRYKAFFGLCRFSLTRPLTSIASPSPDFQPPATRTGAFWPTSPFLPFTCYSRAGWIFSHLAIFSLCRFCWTRPITFSAILPPFTIVLDLVCLPLYPVSSLTQAKEGKKDKQCEKVCERLFHLNNCWLWLECPISYSILKAVLS